MFLDYQFVASIVSSAHAYRTQTLHTDTDIAYRTQTLNFIMNSSSLLCYWISKYIVTVELHYDYIWIFIILWGCFFIHVILWCSFGAIGSIVNGNIASFKPIWPFHTSRPFNQTPEMMLETKLKGHSKWKFVQRGQLFYHKRGFEWNQCIVMNNIKLNYLKFKYMEDKTLNNCSKAFCNKYL